MIAQVYQLTGSVTRSVRRAVLVNEVEIDAIPQDQVDFAAAHGGDFIEIVDDGHADAEADEVDQWLSMSV